mmetsp:Transcript_71260/g.82899  ORF Transcript_71260/g.82899 Transcript_71260/m.82899 type:complete len:118 (+) Transcript_71260:35-388(+)
MGSTGFESELKEFVKQADGYVSQKYLTRVKDRFQYLEQRCYVQAKNNEYKFADCMVDVTKKLMDEERTMVYKHHFLEQNLYECFARGSGKPDLLSKCKSYTIEMIDKSYENFFKNVN